MTSHLTNRRPKGPRMMMMKVQNNFGHMVVWRRRGPPAMSEMACLMQLCWQQCYQLLSHLFTSLLCTGQKLKRDNMPLKFIEYFL